MLVAGIDTTSTHFLAILQVRQIPKDKRLEHQNLRDKPPSDLNEMGGVGHLC